MDASESVDTSKSQAEVAAGNQPPQEMLFVSEYVLDQELVVEIDYELDETHVDYEVSARPIEIRRVAVGNFFRS